MANETLIAYENEQKQKNLDSITTLNNTITSIDQAIDQMEANIDAYNAQKTSVLDQISDIETENALIDEIITILSQ
jgi:predicted  nucleic acid-binding Zn-ribbon protein